MSTMATMAEHEEQGDPFATDDWSSQSSRSSHTSPCGAAHTLDRAHRAVADAVLSELQIDLQAQVQYALNQMNSWITEEITFASTNFQSDMEQAVELVLTSWRKELEEVQSSQSESDREFRHMHTNLEEKIKSMMNGKEESSNDQAPTTWKNECLVLKTCHAELDYKLQSLQASLEEQMQCTKRACEDSISVMRPGIQSELQCSYAELECKMKILQSDIEDEIQSVKRELEGNSHCTQPCTQNDLHNSHAELDCKIKMVQCSLEEQVQSARRLFEDSSHWIQQRGQNESQPSSKVMEARVVAEDRKWRLKFDQLQDNLSQHLRRIEALDSQSDHLLRKVASNDIGLEKVVSSVRELDSRLAKITKEEVAVKESFDKRIRQMELTNFPSKVTELDRDLKELVSKAESMEAKMVGETSQKKALEKRVHEIERLKLSDKLEELEGMAKEVLSKAESTEERSVVDVAQREKLEKRIRQIELMNIGKQIAELEGVSKDLVSKSGDMEAKLAADVAQQKQKLEGCQFSLDSHLAHIQRLDEQKEDLAGKLVVLTGTCEQSNNELQRLDTQRIAAERDIGDIRTSVDACGERLEALEGEVADLEESVVSYSNATEEQLKGIPVAFRTELRGIEDSFSRTVQDLHADFNHTTTELSVGLAAKAPRSDVEIIQDSVQMWVEDARKAHQLAMEALASSMEQVQASSLQQSIEIKRHQEYMKELSAFINEGVEREQCIHDVLLHIVEEDHPDLMGLLEQRLRHSSRALR
jgi:predicted  nucleic acid-binding Zn-ribbon protein